MSEPLDDAAAKRVLIRLGGAVAGWLLPVYVILRVRGIGGLANGWVWCALVLIGGAVVATVLIGRRLPFWYAYPGAVALIGAVLALQLWNSAPLGRERLAGYVDGLGIEGKVVAEKAAGSTTCSPRCPVLTRRYQLAYTRTNVAQTVTESALLREGYSVKRLVRKGDSFKIDNAITHVEASFDRSADGVQAILVFTAKRR